MMSIRHLWGIAPVSTINLLETTGGVIDSNFNQLLANASLAAFDGYLTTRGGGGGGSVVPSTTTPDGGTKRRRRRSSSSSSSSLRTGSKNDTTTTVVDVNDTTMNDRFFEHQRTHGYHLATKPLSQSPEALHLHAKILPNATMDYLQQACDDTTTNVVRTHLEKGLVSVDMWCAIQKGMGAHHPDHVHEGAFVSGVYYVNVPHGSAPLVLRNPLDVGMDHEDSIGTDEEDEDEDCCFKVLNERGDIMFQPRDGHLILFPPWLYHGVPLVKEDDDDASGTTKQQQEDARISFAFNVTGPCVYGDPWDVTRISKI